MMGARLNAKWHLAADVEIICAASAWRRAVSSRQPFHLSLDFDIINIVQYNIPSQYSLEVSPYTTSRPY